MIIILGFARKDFRIVQEVKKCFESESHMFTMGDDESGKFTVKCITVNESKVFITSELVGVVNKTRETCNVSRDLSDYYMYQIELAYKQNNKDITDEQYILLESC